MKSNHKIFKMAMLLFVFALISMAFVLNVGCGGGGGGGGGGGDVTPTSTATAGVVTGSVVDETGAAERDVTVYWGFFKKAGSTLTDANGNYSLSNVSSGYQIITAVRNNSAARSIQVYVESDSSTAAPTIQLEPVGTVEGYVWNASTGIAISGATITAQLPAWGIEVSTTSGSDGFYQLPYVDVAPDIDISCTANGYIGSSTEVAVDEGATSQQDFQLTSGGTPTPTPTSTDYVVDGKKWFDLPVTYYINPTNGQPSESNFTDAVYTGAEKWNYAGSQFRFSYQGTTSTGFNVGDGINVWAWNTTGSGMDEDTLAVTQFQYYTSSKEIIECDVDYNGTHSWTWAETTSEPYDVQCVATHEAGHWLWLGHPNDTGQVMYYRYQGHRELGDGDIAGIIYLYGSGLIKR